MYQYRIVHELKSRMCYSCPFLIPCVIFRLTIYNYGNLDSLVHVQLTGFITYVGVSYISIFI